MSRSQSSVTNMRAVTNRSETSLRNAEGRIVSTLTGIIDEGMVGELHRQILEIVRIRGVDQSELVWLIDGTNALRFDATIKDMLIEVIELFARNFGRNLVLMASSQELGVFRAFMMSASMGRMKLHIAENLKEAELIASGLK